MTTKHSFEIFFNPFCQWQFLVVLNIPIKKKYLNTSKATVFKFSKVFEVCISNMVLPICLNNYFDYGKK